MHRRAIQVESPLPRLQVGAGYQAVEHSLVINAQKLLDFQYLPVWKPQPVHPQAISGSRISGSLPLLIDLLLEKHVPSGLGHLIASILGLTVQRERAIQQNPNSYLTEKAWPCIQELIQVSAEQDPGKVIHCAQPLLGLGEGLTPSGDDFLGGFFFSQHYLPIDQPATHHLPFSHYSEFIESSKHLTNPISHTILDDHAAGHSVDALHRLVNGLIAGDTVAHLLQHAERLITLGNSTGWDVLTGFVAGMSTAIARQNLILNFVIL